MKYEKLGECCQIEMGQAPEGETYNDQGIGLPLIAGAGDFGDFFPNPKKFTTKPGKQTQKDDIILCIRATIGDVNWSDQNYCLGRGVAGLRVDKEKLNNRFLWHFIQSNKQELAAQGTGSTFKQVSKKHIFDWEIPLPPLPEQTRIAAILDQADKIRQKRRRAAALADEFLRSVFLEMFGDPVSNPKGWEKVKMEKLMSIVRGGSPRPIDKFLGGTYPWIKIGDATQGDDLYISNTKENIIEAGLSKTRLLPEGSVIFANCGVSLGFARIIKIEGCIHDGWLAFQNIDEKRIDKVFLLKALNSITQYFRDIAPDGTQPNLNTNMMKQFELILPPIDLQKKFVKIVHHYHQLNEHQSLLINNSETLFQSLSQQFFNPA